MIPHDLKMLKRWAITDESKIPLEPSGYMRYGRSQAFSIHAGHTFITFDDALEIVKAYPDRYIRPCFWIQEDDPFVIIDIEPFGATFKNNPYGTLPYTYLERSTNGGYHGVLPFLLVDQDLAWLKQKTVVDDKEWDTEVHLSNHFVTFTLDIVDLPQDPPVTSYLVDFQRNIQNYWASLSHRPQDSDIMCAPGDMELTERAERLFEIYMQTNNETIDSESEPDPSQADFFHCMTLATHFLHLDDRLVANRSELVDLVTHTALATLVERDKYHEFRNHQEYGHVTYLQMVAASATSASVNAYVKDNPFKSFG